jgi:large subunit ribosomal protein L1
MSKTSQENKAKKAEQKSGVEVLSEVETQKAVTEANAVVEETPAETEETAESHKVKIAKVRGKKYQTVKKKVDVTKYYSLSEAVKLVKETSFSKFDGKIEAHITTYDIGNVGEISFPHLETASKKIVVLNDTILAEIKNGQVNFDIIIATPATMPKLLPFARVLGPKGLMPNPKNGTLTDDPETAVKRLSVAKTIVKTEKKAPIVHIVVGKVSQDPEELIANINELIKVVKANKIKKLALCATMGPCVKVEVK